MSLQWHTADVPLVQPNSTEDVLLSAHALHNNGPCLLHKTKQPPIHDVGNESMTSSADKYTGCLQHARQSRMTIHWLDQSGKLQEKLKQNPILAPV